MQTAASYLTNVIIKSARHAAVSSIASLSGNLLETLGNSLTTVLTTVVVTAVVVTDNLLGTNITGNIANSGDVPNSQYDNWNSAVTSANKTTQGVSEFSIFAVGIITGGSVAVTEGTFGLFSEITIPTAITCLGISTVGSLMTVNSTRNLSTRKKLIKEKEASNKNNKEDAKAAEQRAN